MMRQVPSPTLRIGEDPGAEPGYERARRVRAEIRAQLETNHEQPRDREHRHHFAIVRLLTGRTEQELLTADPDDLRNLHKSFLDNAGLECAGDLHG